MRPLKFGHVGARTALSAIRVVPAVCVGLARLELFWFPDRADKAVRAPVRHETQRQRDNSRKTPMAHALRLGRRPIRFSRLALARLLAALRCAGCDANAQLSS